MHFEYPWVLLLGLFFLFCERRCPLRLELLYFPHVGRIARLGRRTSLQQALRWMVWGGVLMALASPVTVREYQPAHRMGRDLVLVVDASRSMDEPFAVGQRANKFQTLKKVLESFIQTRKNDRLGMVVFGEYAYTVSPLTFDGQILGKMVSHLHVGMAGERTAISDALAMAAELAAKGEATSKVIVLITDGRNTAGRVPFDVVRKLLKSYGIRLYTIGVGVRGQYDAALLGSLAKESGGKFFEAGDARALAKVYRAIDRLEPSKVPDKPIRERIYHYSAPLFAAAIALLFYLFLINRSEVS